MCDCSGGCGGAKKKPDTKPSAVKPCDKCKKIPTINAKKASYVVVLDKSGNPATGYPQLEFEIANGCPHFYIDIQVSKDDASALSGRLGLAGAWDAGKPAKDRIKQKAFSSWTNGQTSLKLDGAGKATYKMPLKWWQDLARQPRSTFTTQKLYFRVVSAHAASAASTNDSTVSNIEVQNNLVDFRTVFKGYTNGGATHRQEVKFTVREANTTEMYTVVQWIWGTNRIWGGSSNYCINVHYGLSHKADQRTRMVDSSSTNPRPNFFGGSGGPSVTPDGKTAYGVDPPGGPIGGSDTHDYYSKDFESRVHLNFEVPNTVKITERVGSAPVYDRLVGVLDDPQPITLDSATWKVRILQIKTGTGVTITHPNTYGGP